MKLLYNAILIYDYRHECQVVKYGPLRDVVTVKFLDPNLVPPEMEVPINYVTYPSGAQLKNASFVCPTCDVEWKERMLARFSVFDCPKCGAKKENFV